MQYCVGHCYTQKLFIVYQTYTNLTGHAVFYLLPGGLGETQFTAVPDSLGLG